MGFGHGLVSLLVSRQDHLKNLNNKESVDLTRRDTLQVYPMHAVRLL